jgi:hypothetical protein
LLAGQQPPHSLQTFLLQVPLLLPELLPPFLPGKAKLGTRCPLVQQEKVKIIYSHCPGQLTLQSGGPSSQFCILLHSRPLMFPVRGRVVSSSPAWPLFPRELPAHSPSAPGLPGVHSRACVGDPPESGTGARSEQDPGLQKWGIALGELGLPLPQK